MLLVSSMYCGRNGVVIVIEVISEIITYLLAVYGAFALIISIINSIHIGSMNENSGMKLVLIQRNQEETIEGVVRSILAKDLINMITPGENLTVLDMGSTDETIEVLTKLENDYECIEVLKSGEREKIFEYFEKVPDKE